MRKQLKRPTQLKSLNMIIILKDIDSNFAINKNLNQFCVFYNFAINIPPVPDLKPNLTVFSINPGLNGIFRLVWL
jgi:hypothetical protein